MKSNILLIITFFFLIPMAYSTDTDLLNAFDEHQVLQLVDDANTGIGTLDEVKEIAADSGHEQSAESGRMLERIESTRADADELIDTFLRTQYNVPVDPVPGIVNSLSVDLHIHNLYQRRMRADMPEHILALEKRAIAKLEKIQRGIIKIQDKPDVASAQIVTNKRASDRMFPDSLLKRF